MNQKPRRNDPKLPQTELTFYIKLYCDRKGSTKTKYQNNIIEATKSWLSLNEFEKQKFHSKFKEYEEKCKTQVFNQIKSVKPYMKIKKVRNTDTTANYFENKEPEKDFPHYIPETQPAVSPPLETNSENNFAEEITNSEAPTHIEFEDQNQHRDETDNTIIDEPPQLLLVEPIPPTIKTGHQLFYMLNSTDESDKIAWTSLPQFEKNRYSRAVLLLKRDYISKYKEYLESLSPKELFNYYNRTCFYHSLLFSLP